MAEGFLPADVNQALDDAPLEGGPLAKEVIQLGPDRLELLVSPAAVSFVSFVSFVRRVGRPSHPARTER